ncbi:hypothetical protein V2J09_014264 [Rumex salicifolius]
MVSSDQLSYAIAAERRAFDETKAGVKGLVDSGITSVPRIFNHQYSNALQPETATVPTIDLRGVGHDATLRSIAVINHGISNETLDKALLGARAFFDQDINVKQHYYTRDMAGTKVVYNSNFDLHRRRGAADWRDSFRCLMAPNPTKKEELPKPCREPLFEYGSQVMGLGKLLFELISDGLRLGPDKLLSMGCADGLVLVGHYYPPCPEPEKTMGTTQHQDNDFITLLLQDKEIGGLQAKYQGRWLDVPPLPGAIVVNIGDFLQLITNDKLKSVEHRVLTNKKGPRISIACFFNTDLAPNPKKLRPMEELSSDDNPPRYRETTVKDYNNFFPTELKAFDETKAGVKGLVDAGISTVPSIFIHPPTTVSQPSTALFTVPIIDLKDAKTDSKSRSDIITKIRDASENFGFFQVPNHGVPSSVLEDGLARVEGFYEQDDTIKRQ